MKRISFRDVGLKYVLSPYDQPVSYLQPPERIRIEVEDAASGQIRTDADSRDRSTIPFGNPVVGPLYIEDAEQGDVLSITIEDIMPTIGQGTTYLSAFNETYVAGTSILDFVNTRFPRIPKICKISDGKVYFSDVLVFPYQPMVGTIGVAPHPEMESLSSGVLPGRHGGNMDLPDVKPSSTILLPVFYEGALLYVGDAHAIQGDGEISGTAVEMPAEITLSIDVLKGETIRWPRIQTATDVMCVGTTAAGRSFEDAIRNAFLELALWIEREYGLNRFDALILCSQIGKIRVGNLWSVAAKIEKQYLEQLRLKA